MTARRVVLGVAALAIVAHAAVARLVALGSGVAVPHALDAAPFNPAAAASHRAGFAASFYTTGDAVDMNGLLLQARLPLLRNGTAVATISRRWVDDIVDNPELSAAGLDVGTTAVALGYAHQAGPLALGFIARATRARVFSSGADAASFDLGALLDLDPLRLGMAIANLGPDIRWRTGDFTTTSLPGTRLRLGSSFRVARSGLTGLLLAHWTVPLDREALSELGVGTDIGLAQVLFARVGVARGGNPDGSGFIQVSYGLGLRIAAVRLDVAQQRRPESDVLGLPWFVTLTLESQSRD